MKRSSRCRTTSGPGLTKVCERNGTGLTSLTNDDRFVIRLRRSTGAGERLGGNMRRNLAFGGPTRVMGRSVSSVACLAFVIFLAVAFWAGAVWIAEFLMRVSAQGF